MTSDQLQASLANLRMLKQAAVNEGSLELLRQLFSRAGSSLYGSVKAHPLPWGLGAGLTYYAAPDLLKPPARELGEKLYTYGATT